MACSADFLQNYTFSILIVAAYMSPMYAQRSPEQDKCLASRAAWDADCLRWAATLCQRGVGMASVELLHR
jgi:hypothetical protein